MKVSLQPLHTIPKHSSTHFFREVSVSANFENARRLVNRISGYLREDFGP